MGARYLLGVPRNTVGDIGLLESVGPHPEEWGLGNYQPGIPCRIPGFQSVTKEQVMQLKDALKATQRKKKNRS